MIPNAKELLLKEGCILNTDIHFNDVEVEDLHKFAIEILKHNLKQYKTQMFQFNTGDATTYKSFDEITLETIKELEDGK